MLVAGLKELYRRLKDAKVWMEPELPEPDGSPRVHDILAAIGIINTTSEYEDAGESQEREESEVSEVSGSQDESAQSSRIDSPEVTNEGETSLGSTDTDSTVYGFIDWDGSQ